MLEPIEQRVEGYQNLVDCLMERVKILVEDYVRDIATDAFNKAISEARFEARTFSVIDVAPEDICEGISDDIQKLRIR